MTIILLTGATGFVGRHVLRHLLEAGACVRAVVRPGRPLPDGVARIETPDVFAESPAWWETHLRGIDTVIHCAWYAEPGAYLFDPRNHDCLVGTLALARAATRVGVRRLVGVGTCFEYDLSARVLSTDTALRPSTPYAACKAAAFLALSQTLPKADVSFAWARLFYLYGEGEDPRRLVPYLHDRLSKGQPADLTQGFQIRDFMNVAEAGAQIASLALPGPGRDVQGAVNICSGKPVTVRELAMSVAHGYGRPDLLRFGARAENAVEPDCVLGIATTW